jgi:hypothetical protein
MTNGAAHTLDDAPVESPDHEQTVDAMRRADIYGAISTIQAQKLYEEMSRQSTAPPPKDLQPPPDDVDPPLVREKRLRDDIKDMHRKGYSPADPKTQEIIHRRGKAMWHIFKKSVEDMTEQELQYVAHHPEMWAQP